MSKYVLLVDDEELFLKLESHYLNSLNILWLSATSGPEALNILRERHHEICAIILDISMPHMSGYEVSRIIRNELKLTDLPILALTTLRWIESKQVISEAGMNAMLSKPFRGSRLIDILVDFGVIDSEEIIK